MRRAHRAPVQAQQQQAEISEAVTSVIIAKGSSRLRPVLPRERGADATRDDRGSEQRQEQR